MIWFELKDLSQNEQKSLKRLPQKKTAFEDNAYNANTREQSGNSDVATSSPPNMSLSSVPRQTQWKSDQILEVNHKVKT